MNHDTAAQLVSGGWHYVRSNRRTGVYPIGTCREHPPHATEAEARECYAAFRRANVRLDGKLGSWSDCRMPNCAAPTKNYAAVRHDGFSMAPLCPEHLTTEGAIAVLGLDAPAGDSWHS